MATNDAVIREATRTEQWAPISIVDRRDEFTPAGAHLSDACQLWSGVAVP